MKKHPAVALCVLLGLALAAFACRGGPARALGADDAAGPPTWLAWSVHLDRTGVPRGGEFRLAVVLQIARGYHLNANPASAGFLLPTLLEPQPHPAIQWGAVEYPPGRTFRPAWASDLADLSVYEGRTVIILHGRAADDAPLGPATARLALSYQGCSETTCFQPASHVIEAPIEILEKGARTEPAAVAIFRAPPRAAAPKVRFEGESDVASAFQRGILVYFAALFLGGLALNLTPCVFPLIPVTMNVFAQQGESRPAKVLPLALVYAGGLAATFTLVGVLAALAGTSLGLVLQSPWGVLAVVAVLATMMASAFGAFDLQLPSGAMGKLGARRGFLGAAFMGAVMGAVAAPCVGPFLIALITFIATAPYVAAARVGLGAISFFTVGLGLGVPYIFLGTFTGLVNRFPRSGGWLVWTKRLMAMALAGLILYFMRPFIQAEFARVLGTALFLFAAAYLGFLEGLSRRPFSARFWAVRIVAAASLVAGGLIFHAAYAPASGAGEASDDAGGPHVQWTPWTEGALEAARADQRPVLLYFTADWCLECRHWKAAIWSDPKVIRAAEGFARILVDVTDPPTGAKRAVAEAYRGVNPPAVILIGRDGEVHKAYRDPPTAAAFFRVLRELDPRESFEDMGWRASRPGQPSRRSSGRFAGRPITGPLFPDPLEPARIDHLEQVRPVGVSAHAFLAEVFDLDLDVHAREVRVEDEVDDAVGLAGKGLEVPAALGFARHGWSLGARPGWARPRVSK